MSIGTGIDDDAVRLAVGLLDGVHQISLVVGLIQRNFNADLRRMGFNEPAKIRIGGLAVDLRFTDSQHVEVRTVNDKNVHENTNPQIIMKNEK